MPTTLDSVCPLDCPDTCSLSVTVDDGRITKVDGSQRNPYTAGYICAKVRRYPERIYSPLRVLYPQRRVGAKGEARFERISWDEAIDLIAARFKQIIADDGAEAILPYHYGGSNGVFGEGATDARFFNRLGASELLEDAVRRADRDGVSRHVRRHGRRAAGGLSAGARDHAVGRESVGDQHPPRPAGARGAGAPARSSRSSIRAARRWRARADLHLQPLPGTDVVLALAMINELIRAGARRPRFIAAHVERLRDARARPRPSTRCARAAEICDVPARTTSGARRGLRRRLARGDPLRLGRRAQPQRRQRGARHPGAAGGRREVRRARRRHDDEPEPRLSGQRLRAGAPGSARGRAAPDQHDPARPRAHRAADTADARAVRLQRQPGGDDARTRTASCAAWRARTCSPSCTSR